MPSSLLVCGLVLIAQHAIAQGCSDAGVCTAGPIVEIPVLTDSTSTEKEPRHYARMTFSYAIGERSTTVLQVIPEVGFGITNRWGVQLRVPYMSIEGDLGSNSGVGDPVLTTSYAFIKEDQRRLDAMVGVKLNSGNADDPLEGTSTAMTTRSLPMPYQTSLGTTDLLVGVNYRHKRWTGALAWQHVLVHQNKNDYLHLNWLDNAVGRAYFESAGLERADDAVARLLYAIPIGKLTIQPGILAIMHLGQDTRERPLTFDRSERIAIEGSEGLTLNLTADLRYKLSSSWWLEASAGAPSVVREVRPDGLTRALVANVGLRFAF
ncbi:MAG: hypothetical protein QY325_05615 [Flavobacteriales bacterium]|nr:MAG: hypothetical protein QY325_05615 [Flavobacteriales bacterium]